LPALTLVGFLSDNEDKKSTTWTSSVQLIVRRGSGCRGLLEEGMVGPVGDGTAVTISLSYIPVDMLESVLVAIHFWWQPQAQTMAS
jgi:hypothetical protein